MKRKPLTNKEGEVRELTQNTIATFNVLEAMRTNGAKRIAFASTGSIYGEALVIPTPEHAPFPIQTSLYDDCSRIRNLGWQPKLSIREGILQTIKYLHQNSWVIEKQA